MPRQVLGVFQAWWHVLLNCTQQWRRTDRVAACAAKVVVAAVSAFPNTQVSQTHLLLLLLLALRYLQLRL
jgi:hypothetical protein